MRELTKEELKLAPDWATHYHANHNESILFECHYQYCLYEKGAGLTVPVGCFGVCKESKPIPKKPFDITKHEFDDPAWSINEVNAEHGYIDFYNHETCTDDGDHESHSINKDDAIAITKALGATAEDFM